MKKLTISIMTCLALAGSLFGVADTVFRMPDSMGKNPDAAREGAGMKLSAAENRRLVDDFMKHNPFASASDRMALEMYLDENGTMPSMAPAFSPFGPEDDTKYTYTGFNMAAGLKEDGTTSTGGLVNFNIQPFACDTVSSDPGVSPYSFVKKEKLYCFLPVTDAYGTYTGMTVTTYNANSLEKLDSKTVDLPVKSSAYVPYIASYDDRRDMVYAISLENGKDRDGNSITDYYLNLVDMDSWRLKRIAFLGNWSSVKAAGNFNPKGMVCSYGSCYLLNSAGDKIYVERLNVANGERTEVGYTELPTEYVYGLQPMVLDSGGSLIVNHYNLSDGTVYYKVQPFVAYGSSELICKTELLEKAPTGFTFFYQRPETKPSYQSKFLDPIDDLKIAVESGSNDASVSMTVPKTINGGETIEIPTWSNDRVRLYVYVDNEYTNVTLPQEIHLGDKLDFKVENIKNGVHVVTVQLSPMYNELGQYIQSETVCAGYDVPGDVINPTLKMENGKAIISWTAPEKGKFADFGDFFDPSDLTYTVIRDHDGKEIAKDITQTSCEDSDLGEIIRSYTYTVRATSHGASNNGVQTNVVTAGNYLELPYENHFDVQADIYGWNIINANNDGSYRTWAVNTYSHEMINPSGSNGADDWLISPNVKLEKGKVYELAYIRSMGSELPDGSLRVAIGKGNTPEDQDEILADFNKDKAFKEMTRHYYAPSENGLYNFSFYDYSISEYNVGIDEVSFKEIAVVTAPAQVRQLTVVPDAAGAIGATVKCTLPTNDIAGNKISEITKVTVYDPVWNEVATKNNVKPGEDISIPVKAEDGVNRFFVVASNADGEGWPAEGKAFVGLDVPSPVSKIDAHWGDDENVAVITWENVLTGANGGYVNPADFTYTIYKYDSSAWPSYVKLGETTADENEIEISLMDIDTSAQDYYIFGLTASNDKGESDYMRKGIVLGKSYTLPFVEPFTSQGLAHQPYITKTGVNGSGWQVDGGFYNADVQPYDEGAGLVSVNTTSGADDCGFISPIIDFSKVKNPVFEIWLHHSDAMPEGAYMAVKASVDGSSNYIECGSHAILTGNNGWQKHIFDLSKLAGKKAQVMLYGYMSEPRARIFADSWNIHEAKGNDIAVTGISKPYLPKVGDKAEIKVTVSNLGAAAASGYSVLFNVDDNTVAELEAKGTLGIGESEVYSFELPITPRGDVLYNAEVIYDDDNADNNVSSEVEISPDQVNLPAPENAALADGDKLTWSAPEQPVAEEVTLDFEDMPAFLIDDIDGWKTADVDGNITMTFVQYYGNYWPYANQKFAWMTWSPREAGCPDAEIWKSHDSDKCLIHFGNYGLDEEGRANEKNDDDWFISPELIGGTDLSFMIKTTGTAKMEVLSSTTDRNTADFTNVLKTFEIATPYEWSEVKVTVPSDAKYVAIRTVFDDFGILIDDITYTPARLPQFKGYNVYRNNSAAWFGTQTSWAMPEGGGRFAVSALYDMGESAFSNAVEVSGVDNVSGDSSVRVSGGKGSITVTGCDGSRVRIFAANGQEMVNTRVTDRAEWNVSAGVYVVSVDGKAVKVLVK